MASRTAVCACADPLMFCLLTGCECSVCEQKSDDLFAVNGEGWRRLKIRAAEWLCIPFDEMDDDQIEEFEQLHRDLHAFVAEYLP